MSEQKDEEQYVLVDLRSIVGNCVMFWAEGCSGYTCELDKAEVFSAKSAFSQHECRPNIDQPIPLSVARDLVVQHVRREPLNRWIYDNPDPRRTDPPWVAAKRKYEAEKAAEREAECRS